MNLPLQRQLYYNETNVIGTLL
ncbi:hypothetical protein NC653_029125 [Populus alba x Populus x berolinensis]|uniref:Uncharacterized protein n=1 Tax=Populus alba x Populus x berolinensis TaxID=444605 RepID=A0AAD6M1P5_9ROSI|nr:hypothetical protein NC653_029125 [Populus alba x Populus x berolinensis]